MREMNLIALAALAALLMAAPAFAGNFVAHLDTASIPGGVGVESNATGQAVVKDHRNGELSFKVLVAGLQNAVIAHIHCGEVGEVGPPAVLLFPLTLPPIDVNGILAQGPIEVTPDNDCGWVDNFDVIDAINDGNAYVNIHTAQNQPGEIRGQLE